MHRSNTNISLWSLIFGTPEIDPGELFNVMEAELKNTDLDFRTRLLLRDAYTALANRWGDVRLKAKLSPDSAHRLKAILQEELGPPGFTTLEQRMKNAVDPQTIIEFLRELGAKSHTATRLEIGGSCSLILRDLLGRSTDDIDAVDEIPQSLRVEHELLNSLAQRYGLRLTHFQSHYLPDGWKDRLQSFGKYSQLEVYLVSEWDIIIGKLFSKRTKDLDDLRLLFRRFSKSEAIAQLAHTGRTLLAEPSLNANARMNWSILFGEELPA